MTVQSHDWSGYSDDERQAIENRLIDLVWCYRRIGAGWAEAFKRGDPHHLLTTETTDFIRAMDAYAEATGLKFSANWQSDLRRFHTATSA